MMKIQDLSFGYKKNAPVLQNFNLDLQKGELLAIMGPSGCGKSTLLQLIAGFLSPTDGVIQTDAEKISYAFQEPRLFPWMTVKENLKAVLPKDAEASKIYDVLQFVELADAEKLYPNQLSGGMQSRAALARALLYGGDLFLMDEPFSALDEALSKELTQKLRAALQGKGASAILVTHQTEVAELFADRIIHLSKI